jgi:hypothetical protein
MEVFGWLVLAAVLSACTLASAIALLYTLGRYSIGGVPHTTLDRVTSAAFLGVCLWLWLKLLPLAPFTFALK